YVLRKNEGEELPVISVVRETEAQLLPDVGAIVTCKVTSINPRFAKVHILYVETYKSFRPGDIVLAKVISLGDVQSNYLLTTAENELGVVVAHSEAGGGHYYCCLPGLTPEKTVSMVLSAALLVDLGFFFFF
ncbi:unnamed protein product, partial [Coregonus sp. 'balchen']